MRNPLDRIRRLRREAGNRRDVEAHTPPGPPWTNIREVAGLETRTGRVRESLYVWIGVDCTSWR